MYTTEMFWKEFLNPNGMPFLSVPFKFALTLNIDWFQPFKHTNHVEELIELWEGVIMQSFSKTNVLVRAALLCTACDIPAARKVSGFVGHSALHGCSKCLKTFPTACFGDKPDYTAHFSM